MTQYNFTTNIEKRMPTTGEVFFVDRMTSDYAVQHPFDVDAFIESVFQKYEQMAQGDAYARAMGWNETREALRRQWDATLGERNPRGNAALYPNKNGEKHPALMEVWHKAGDYWRRGLRLGDVLPAVVPPCKITRTEDGWIALFPKDVHLLEQQADQPAKPETEVTAPAVEPIEPAEQEQPEVCPVVLPQEEEEEAPTPSPIAQMQAELEALRQENEELRMKNEEFATAQRLQAEREAARREAEAQQHQREQEQERQRRDQELQALVERELQRQLHRSHDIAPENNQHPTDEPAQPSTARRNRRAVAARPLVACYQRDARNSSFFTLHSSFLKPLAVAAASVVACIVIYETGLLIPMGLIGLATSGLVK